MSFGLPIRSYWAFNRYFYLLIIAVFHSLSIVAQSKVGILKNASEDYSHFIGEKVLESKEEIFSSLQNTQDTFSLKKNLIKKTSILNNKKTNIIKALRDDNYEKIILKNGTVLRGFTISENENYIEFDVSTLADTFLVSKDQVVKFINQRDYFIYSEDKYHKKEGGVNSIRLLFGTDFAGDATQFEIIRYRFLNPKLAFGVGAGILSGYFDFNSVRFTEVFLYSKKYLTNNQKRLFFDAKVGFAITHDSKQIYEREKFVAYSSGQQLQYGIGIDFANSREYKFALYFNNLLQRTKYDYRNPVPSGVINISEYRIVNFLTAGISFNF